MRCAKKTLLEEERLALRNFDEGLFSQWEALICDQMKEMEEIGLPYFGSQAESERQNRHKIVALLEDLISGESE